jgi:phosphate transport system protein
MNTPHRHGDELLEKISEKILVMGGLVEDAIGRALNALVDRDSELARRVVDEDVLVDRLELEIDHLSLEALALKQPYARDLRLVTTAMKITTDLERIGDLAVNVSERAIELNAEPQLKPFVEIPMMALRAQEMVHGALDAFVRRDADLARAVIAMDDDLDRRLEQVFRDLLAYMMEKPASITRALRLTFVSKYFERVGDQATNICEQVVYMTEGRVIKHPAVSSEGPEEP